ncbi:MAG: hypothetical protein IKI13_08520 [Bacteroidales bacterium]|jgi:hypothetical protein|nr:hypothetical protein [Bacteroidales bacterium]
MKTLIKFILVAALVFTASCSKDNLDLSQQSDYLSAIVALAKASDESTEYDPSESTEYDPSAPFTVDDVLDHIFNSSNQVRTYRIAFNFKDADGNELSEPFVEEQWIRKGDSRWWGEINPDKYKLDFILPNPPAWWDNTIYNHRAAPGFIPDVNRPRLSMCRFDDKGVMSDNTLVAEENDNCSWYLCNEFGYMIDDFALQETIKYQLTCPTIFGDNAVHEFITYWKEDEDLNPDAAQRFATCTKVEYDGKEITPIKGVTIMHYEFPDPYEDVDVRYVHYLVDIVVDK